MDLKFKTFDFEMKATGEAGASFEGIVSAFYNIDSYGEIVDDTAFDMDLPSFLSGGFIGGLNHDWDNPIGTPQPGTKVVANGLFLKANVIDTTHGMDVRKMLKAGVVKKLSIGYRQLGSQVLETADDCMAYWKSKGYTPNAQDMARCQTGALLLTRMFPLEGSPVVIPANDAADITAVKMRAAKAIQDCIGDGCSCGKQDAPVPDDTPTSIREAETILRDAGLSRTKAQEAIARLKSLLRDSAGEGSGRKQDGDAAEGADASETPAETPEATEDAPATNPTAETTDENAAPDEPPVTPVADEPQTPKSAEPVAVVEEEKFGEDLPSTKILRQAQQRKSRELFQQFRELDARLDRWSPPV